MKSLLQFSFLKPTPDGALLLLRLWLAISMLGLHGWPKLQKLIAGHHRFADPLGIGELPSLVLAVFSEVLGCAMLVFGWYARLGALLLAATMAVAFGITHHAKLAGPGNGELAFIYLAGFAALFLAGPGKFSVQRGA